MKKYLILFLIFSGSLQAQTLKKQDKKDLASLKENISYLSDDKLEGRRTGTAGEKLAYTYISKKFKKAGLKPLGSNGSYLQAFDVYDGREVKPSTSLSILSAQKELHTDYFPLAFSGQTENLSFNNIYNPAVQVYDLKDVMAEQKDNPHFDMKDHLLTLAKKAEMEGKKLFVVTNSSAEKDLLAFDPKDKTDKLGIPVIYVTEKLMSLSKVNPDAGVSLTVMTGEKIRTGHNVVGMIDNGSQHHIILGAHYDHLGYGEDHNSLYAGKEPMIHNGADDNASGTSALMALAKKIKKSGLKKYNYILVAFSGEELGLYGSKYFTEHSPVSLSTVNFMINMDMVGRLNDSTRGLTVGGFGTSPSWPEVIKTNHGRFNIKVDSSGSGPSDHTSFYRKDIPVLFFFTGTHSDYHKPSDDADKINYMGCLSIVQYIYDILQWADGKDKLAFTKTREAAATGKSSFKVSMGIMPDYTFSGTGVFVDGVSEGKPAQKAGIKTGDVILQLGEYKVTDVQTYMQALGKFNKGQSVDVKLKRGNEELQVNIVF